MMVRAVKYKEAINATITIHGKRDYISLLLFEADWKLIEDLVEITKPMKDLTLKVSEKGGFNITKVPKY